MLRQAWVIAGKELTDSFRDRRSMLSSALYCLMGPAIVWMVSVATGTSSSQAQMAVLTGMISVFLLVSTFMGGMNVAMDVLAGERERRSLLPLMMNAVTPSAVMTGKWIAVSCLSAAGVLIALGGFAVTLRQSGVGGIHWFSGFFLLLPAVLIPLAMLAAAVELTISIACKNTKEAHTYLSMLVFVPMTVSLYLIFDLGAAQGWIRYVPVVGQLFQVRGWLQAVGIVPIQSLILGTLTLVSAAGVLAAGTHCLKRDDIIYGD